MTAEDLKKLAAATLLRQDRKLSADDMVGGWIDRYRLPQHMKDAGLTFVGAISEEWSQAKHDAFLARNK